MKILNIEEIEYLIIGATILGVGGGGDPKKGLEMLLEDINSGRKHFLIDPSEIPKDSITASAYFCGAIPKPGKIEKRKEFPKENMIKSLEILEKYLSKKVSALVPTELGGGNTAIALHLASMLNIPTLDADIVGRAVPELVHSTYNIYDIPVSPAVISNDLGDIIIFEKYSSIMQYEKIVRDLSIKMGGHVFVIDSPIIAEIANKYTIKNTLSKCIELGAAIVKANKDKNDPIKAILNTLNGILLFKGFIKKYDLNEKEGFLIGTIEIEGIEKYKKQILKIWVKNENIIAWINEKPIAMSPDLICMIDDKGYGIVNSNLKKGLKVSIIGVKSPDVWRTERGIELLGPKHFGFKYKYMPIEFLARSSL